MCPILLTIFQKLAQDPRLEILVAYCSMQGAEARVDPEFGVEVAWDTPLFEGYPWVHVPNRAPARTRTLPSDCSIQACGGWFATGGSTRYFVSGLLLRQCVALRSWREVAWRGPDFSARMPTVCEA